MHNDLASREECFQMKLRINEQVSGNICAQFEVSNCLNCCGIKTGQSFRQTKWLMSNSNFLFIILLKSSIHVVDTRTAEDQCNISNKLLIFRFASAICQFDFKINW